MLVCDTFEELPQEIRARVRLEDPTLVCVRYYPNAEVQCPDMPIAETEGLLLVEVTDDYAHSKRGWALEHLRGHSLGIWCTVGEIWDCMGNLIWVEPHSITLLEP